MRVHNVHERLLDAPVDAPAALLARIGGPHDVLWPSPDWPPMILDGPVAVGARGGHGPIRYAVSAYEPGRRLEFTFSPRGGLTGTHTFTLVPSGPARTLVRHVVEGEASGPAALRWLTMTRFAHDAVLEELLDRAEIALGTGPARRSRRSLVARLVRRGLRPRAQEVAVPATPLLVDALPRVDWHDAHAVLRRPGTTDDPMTWANAVFGNPPAWVATLLGLREALVGLVGIERGGRAAFDPVAVADHEVLLGVDAGHLDFRASVLCKPGATVVTTVVRIHNRRGRAYFALVRLVHPMIVRAMLTRASQSIVAMSDTRHAVIGAPSASRRSAGIGRLPEKSAATTT